MLATQIQLDGITPQRVWVSPTFCPNAKSLPNRLANRYLDALLAGDQQFASRLVFQAFDSGMGLREIYLRIFQPSLRLAACLWQQNEVTVAQEQYLVAATQCIMSELYPYIASTPKSGRRLVATNLCGDVHELGLRMVADLFELEGWEVDYLGANVPADAVLEIAAAREPDVLAISVSITDYLPVAEQLIVRLRARKDCDRVKVLVGGYPFNLNSGLWNEIGADGYAPDAAQAVSVAVRL